MGSKYELSITPEYVKSWEIKDALRELFQNAIDQQELTGIPFSFSYSNGDFHISNPKAWLDRSTLLLGKSSKDDVKTIGKFGEGYKLAFLVFLREGLTVSIENNNYGEIWTASLHPSRRFNGETILLFDIPGIPHKKHLNDKDLVFKISGLSEDLWKDYYQYNLYLSNPTNVISSISGRVLLDQEYSGKVFVGGLYVGSLEGLYYGYDFKPEFLPLDRDRRVLPTYDVLAATSTIWKDSDSPLLLELLKNGHKDVCYVGFHQFKNAKQDLGKLAVKEFIEENGANSYPVSSNKELKVLTEVNPELKPVIVSEQYNYFLSQTGCLDKIDVKNMSSIKGRLGSLKSRIADRLSPEELEELNSIILEVWN